MRWADVGVVIVWSIAVGLLVLLIAAQVFDWRS